MDPTAAQQSWDIAKLLSNTAVVCGLIGVAVRAMILRRRNMQSGAKHAVPLDGMIGAFYTAAVVPGAFFLIACAFKPELIKYLGDFNLSLAAAGISSLYLAYKGIIAD